MNTPALQHQIASAIQAAPVVDIDGVFHAQIPMEMLWEWHLAAKTLTAQPADGVWREIESAPRDGTKIWLWDGKTVFVGKWITKMAFSEKNRTGEWVNDLNSARSPILWFPLPAPPAAARSEEQNGR